MGPVVDYLNTPVESSRFDGIRASIHREDCARKDTYPLPALEDREHYHPGRPYDYWLSGLRDYHRILQEMDDCGASLRPGARILDFGASSGRVLRHFLVQAEGAHHLFGTDLNRNHVEWLNRHFQGRVRAFQCTSLPFLPLEDNTFDLVYAFSVFTHVDELETAWLWELRRILKPRGHAYLTVQSDRTWNTLKETDFLYRHLKDNERLLPDWQIAPELFRRPMPQPKVVFRFRSGPVYNTVVFHHADYIRERWGQCLSVLGIVPEGHEFQDVVLLQKE